jgi:hypothetical protein
MLNYCWKWQKRLYQTNKYLVWKIERNDSAYPRRHFLTFQRPVYFMKLLCPGERINGDNSTTAPSG